MPHAKRERSTPAVVTSAGSLACEAALLDEIDRLLEQLGESILERPIWLVVPSHSLRSHILSKIVDNRGRSVAGLGCWTLHGLASEIVNRAGEPARAGAEILPVLVRRIAPLERPLRDGLDHLTDGYSSVVASVQDLLNAGLDVAHQDALDDVLTEEGSRVSGRAAVQRARSVVRVATRVLAELDNLNLSHNTQILQQATEIVRFSPEGEAEPTGLLVHGFADATGLATDFIVALLERYGGKVFFDLPPDIGDPPQSDSGVEFLRRFRERLEAVADKVPLHEEPPTLEPDIRLFRSHGGQAEVREVATRIRAILDGGTPPEQIGVVARQLEPYVSLLRTHFSRLGIPFSGVGAKGPPLPMGREIQGFVELLNSRQKCSVDRWLDIRDATEASVPSFDLRLGLFGLGARRLEEVARLDLSSIERRDSYPLPVRRGFDFEGEDEDQLYLSRRTIPVALLFQLRKEADDICKIFSAWTDRRNCSSHQELVLDLVTLLGWRGGDAISIELSKVLAKFSAQIPDDLELGLDEITAILTDSLRSVGFCDLGGKGSGVQILDVIEARGHTFEHLFLIGLNQGLFPRTVHEDPLLDDGLRQVIGREGHGVLPDLSRKLVGHSEERYLFAQLLWSSPSVTLSWQFADDDGKALTPSPLLELLGLKKGLRVEGELVSDLARSPFSAAPRQTDVDLPREIFTPFEEAVRTGLWGTHSDLLPAFRMAVEDSAAMGLVQSPSDPVNIDRQPESAMLLAGARLRILAEFDQKPGQVAPPGPFFGYIGSNLDRDDPRTAQPLFITTLERLARCPWQTFLQRLLRLERYPDPTDVLPGIDSLLLGQLVHRVLENIVAEQLDSREISFVKLRDLTPSPIEWPTARTVDKIVERESRHLVREHGLNWDGFAEILSAIALPYVDQARRWSQIDEKTKMPVAVEVEGELEIMGRPVRFRADRVDRKDSALEIVDYKTGRQPIYTAKRETSRHKNLIKAVREGRYLQAAAYSLAGATPRDNGEYVFIRPDFGGSDEARTVIVRGDDAEAREAFLAASETLVETWFRGLFFPRLVEPGSDREPRGCSSCEVAEACLRGDSGARGRLRKWTESESDDSSLLHHAWFMSDQLPAEEPDR